MISDTNDNLKIENSAPDVAVLVIRHLYKSFGNNHVLDDFNLEMQKGESVVVLGRSGSGKSVLIKCVIGLLEPDKGNIELFGDDLTGISEEELDKIRAKVGFLFQSNALYDSMTVRENLEFPLRRHWIQVTQEEVNIMVLDALEDVGLAHTIDMMPVELSGGMRKRIALARTLILKPEIILYDEPTTGLDSITSKEIITLMRVIQEKYNTTSLIISHDMNCVHMASNRVVILVDGKCYASGTYQELEQSMDPKVKQFFE
ncbi:MAG: ATP-binding cassette domain-containing protein [Chitinophagaceae bacterium]|nr:ATP-binding cassette domain-containing protein [Chitinophagaceae bacterium]MDP1763325.1 ATP-binding cassette domain-containing protein [Sediminibacterium sp.]MDP1812153.1 ATP-binding cassette domain-containing protein [Sediminibacterium sp.]MDP3127071.1 ATP-binding cassette domain-containing protein [Sediminibacterium sp.]MDP3667577.1 ATP-binding cassette domain-containing protein [Sediminibacterium sp.]